MEHKNTEACFKYTYSAKEQEEIKKIRQKYQASEEDGMERLRKLDTKVTEKATIMSLIVGVTGTLILGTGMSLVMTDLNKILGIPDMTAMIIGIMIGLIGMIFVALAYPVFNRVLKKERDKIAPEILRLTEELMK